PSGLAVDTVHDQLVVANFGNNSVLVYPRTASGTAGFTRLSGATTGLNGSYGVLVDTVNDELVVPNNNTPSVTVHARTASGDPPPIRTLFGPATGLAGSQGVAITTATSERDLNGDGKADILWRHTSGAVFEWFLNGTAIGGTGSLGSVAADWSIAGVGDFNGDGKADILWRHISGVFYEWLMDGFSVLGTAWPRS